MKYVTIAWYAKLCGVSPQAIRHRINAGTLVIIEIPGPDEVLRKYIDVSTYPPEKRQPGRPKKD